MCIQNGHTALFVAAEGGHLYTIRELLRAKADVNMIRMIHKVRKSAQICLALVFT